jgi:hypothetical protein
VLDLGFPAALAQFVSQQPYFMSRRKLILDKALADDLVEYCQSTLILPDDLIRVAIQQKPKEPFLVDARQLGGGTETERMLRILYALWKGAPEKFDKAAVGIRGHSRLWFSKDRKEITGTGNSNWATRINDSPWWVSTNCPEEGMRSRIEKVMLEMGFSWRYTVLVASCVYDGKGRLRAHEVFDGQAA